jgi:methionine sulfoxide reductase heme-binding subunit
MTLLDSSLANWYLMRATGVTSLVLLSAVLVLGIGTVRRWRAPNAPAFVTAAVHRSISLLSVVFIGVHVVTAMLDPYAAVSVTATVVPFVGSGRPLWVGLGALALDLVVALIVTSLLRRHLGVRAWRSVHWLAYLCWPVAAAHAIGMGSDVRSLWLQAVLAVCVGSLGLALATRLVSGRPGKRLEPPRDRSRRRVGAGVAA